MIYFDQIGVIGKHLHDIKHDKWWQQETNLVEYDSYITKYEKEIITDSDKAARVMAKAMKL